MVEDRLKYFSISVLVSLIIAAIGYSIQFIFLYDSFFGQLDTICFQLFRMVRMVVGYVLIPLIFLNKTGQSFKTMGFHIKSTTDFIKSFFLGIIIYLVPSYIFVKYEIFTYQWSNTEWGEAIILLAIIGVMASITDLWTRGFVLLQLDKMYGKIPAIIGQNVLWFVLHIYEIILLIPYIGLLASIALTLFLGITGDLIAIHYRNITGLMIGHIILNLFIILTGKGVVIL